MNVASINGVRSAYEQKTLWINLLNMKMFCYKLSQVPAY